MNKMMKLATAVVAILALALTSCQKKNELTISAAGLGDALDGAQVALYNSEQTVIDSVTVAGGAFELKVSLEAEETPNIAYLVLGGEHVLILYKEPAALKVVAKEDGNGYILQGDESTLTMKFQNITAELEALTAPYEPQFEALQEEAINAQDDEAKLEELNRKMDSLYAEYTEVQIAKATELYEQYKDTPLALVLFEKLAPETEAKFVELYEAAPTIVKEHPQYKQQYETSLKTLATSVGAKYTDFTMNDGAGNSKKLSDYLTGENYLLVDFFASWCGPCQAAMPHLAELHKEYGKKGLTVLSIGVWESITGESDAAKNLETNKNAAKEWGVVWEHFYDSEATGATEYGVMGIPTLILISPEGEILARSHGVEDVRKVLEERLK